MLEKIGNWLFRWRSYLPFILLGLLIFSLRYFKYIGYSKELDHFWDILCLLISFFGLGIRIYTIGHVPRGTSGRNTARQAADTLNTTGIYSIVRNPLYLGNFFIWLGILLFMNLWWLTLLCLIIFFIYYKLIIFSEEQFLRKKFGTTYDNWTKKTPAFIPKINNWIRPNLPFSLRTVLKKEFNAFFVIIAIFTFIEIIGDTIIEKKIKAEPLWLIIFGVACLVSLTLLILKKTTNILSHEGR